MEISANFQMTYESSEVLRVLRLPKDKARKCPEEPAGWSQGLRLEKPACYVHRKSHVHVHVNI